MYINHGCTRRNPISTQKTKFVKERSDERSEERSEAAAGGDYSDN